MCAEIARQQGRLCRGFVNDPHVNNVSASNNHIVRFRTKREQLKSFQGLVSESQGQNMALTVLYVPCSVLLAAKLRLETMYGQTNCWVLPHEKDGSEVRLHSSKSAHIRQSRSDSGLGTYKTVKAIFWPWLSDKSSLNVLRCSLFARKRLATKRMQQWQKLTRKS